MTGQWSCARGCCVVAESPRDTLSDDSPGVPRTFGEPQRAALVGPKLFRGSGVHAPDTVVDSGRYADLDVRAASVRGTYGRYNGTPREDDYALAHSSDGAWLVIALADGVTSATAAHLGATLAVRTAVQQSVRVLGQQGPEGMFDGKFDGKFDAQGVMQSVAYQLRRAAEPLLSRAGQDATPQAISGLLATTLVLALVPTRDQGQLVQTYRIGDSNAWLLDGGTWDPVFAVKVQTDGVTDSTVSPLPSLPDQIEQASFALPVTQTLMVATDGVTDPFGRGADGEVAAYLAECWGRDALPAPLEFARQLSFRGRSWDDDRTAVAVRRVPTEDARSEPLDRQD